LGKNVNQKIRHLDQYTLQRAYLFLQYHVIILEAALCLLVDVLGLSRRVRGRAVTFLLSFTRV
jgi:hypothetical protein